MFIKLLRDVNIIIIYLFFCVCFVMFYELFIELLRDVNNY